jgi:hypothetical protein
LSCAYQFLDILQCGSGHGQVAREGVPEAMPTEISDLGFDTHLMDFDMGTSKLGIPAMRWLC